MPDCEVGVNIPLAQIDQIKKAAAVLGHAELVIKGDSGRITAEVYDTQDSTSNSFSLVLDEDNECKETFSFIFNIPNLKLMGGDYYVSISSKLISHWTNSDYPINYFIALEKGSSFGV